jgi:hypothetical protein
VLISYQVITITSLQVRPLCSVGLHHSYNTLIQTSRKDIVTYIPATRQRPLSKRSHGYHANTTTGEMMETIVSILYA